MKVFRSAGIATLAVAISLATSLAANCPAFSRARLLAMDPVTYNGAPSTEADPGQRVTSVVDGDFSKRLHLPLYEWYPKNKAPSGLLLCIHGLTLHGKRFEVLGKAFAAEGFYACAPDMRGFGRCYTDTEHKFSVGGDDKRKLDMEKSYADLVALAKMMKEKYPDIPLFAMGESLGTSYCIRIAAEHPELVDGLLLSGPTVKVNPLMFIHPANIAAAAWAVFLQPQFKMNTAPFVKNLVSNDPLIVKEMLDDPLCRKNLTIAELLKTQKFVSKTLAYATKIKADQPVLVLQGSEDRCMVPHAVTLLSKNIHSADQTVRWLHAHGHLLLETSFLRPATVDAIDIWVREHEPPHEQDEKALGKEIIELGAHTEPD
jgi:alpha-beta hydrolase superfamily lysophospholipase